MTVFTLCSLHTLYYTYRFTHRTHAPSIIKRGWSQEAVLNRCLKYEGFSTLLKGIAQEVSSDLSCYQRNSIKTQYLQRRQRWGSGLNTIPL